MSAPDSQPAKDSPAWPSPGRRFVRRSHPSNEGLLLERAIARAREGDNAALRFLYVRFADDVRGYISGIVRDEHEAEDITHTLFAGLLTKLQRYEQRQVPFAAWILRVARNAALDYLRTRRPIPFEQVQTSDEGRHEVDFERNQALKLAFERLPAGQRQVLILRHIAGLSHAEIARCLGKSEGSIYGLHHRGRAALQTTLRELEATPLSASC